MDDTRKKLTALGSEGVLDTLILVNGRGWTTASELAKEMDIHVATAVKRLSILHDAGLVKKQVRKGRTRHADEYSSISRTVTITLYLDGSPDGRTEAIMALLRDILARLGRFGGTGENEVLRRWKNIPGIDEDVISAIQDKKGVNIKTGRLANALLDILDFEAAEYGELTVRALAKASFDAVGVGIPAGILPQKYFGGE